jgi:uncharacterized membrane protein YsdA (DUF1294 family)
MGTALIVIGCIALYFAIITTILFIIDIKKAKQEQRRIKLVYIVLAGISWGIISVIVIILILLFFLFAIGVLGM